MGTNAQRQAAFKARMRQAGKKQIAIWVDPQQEAAITAFLAGATPLPVTPEPSRPGRPIRLPVASRNPRKKRDTREPWQIRNDELWETHHADIRARRAAGQKPSEIAAWLNTLGFTGSGGTLNGYLNSNPRDS
ncbi:MAG: hypothetical protein NTAFB09_21140 [Nitrosospira sp.]